MVQEKWMFQSLTTSVNIVLCKMFILWISAVVTFTVCKIWIGYWRNNKWHMYINHGLPYKAPKWQLINQTTGLYFGISEIKVFFTLSGLLFWMFHNKRISWLHAPPQSSEVREALCRAVSWQAADALRCGPGRRMLHAEDDAVGRFSFASEGHTELL